MTPEHMERALARGREQLAMIDALESTEDFMDGPFRASRQYEDWSGRDYANRRRQLEMAMNDVRREQARRNP